MDVLPGLLQRFAREPATHIPTSQLLRAMLADAAPRRLNLTWLLDRLRQRSFGAILLALGFVAMLPGVNSVAGIDGDDDSGCVVDATNLEKLGIGCVAEVDFVAGVPVCNDSLSIAVGCNVGDMLPAQC